MAVAESVQKHFESAAFSYDRSAEIQDRANTLLARSLRLCHKDGIRILDIACGTGSLSQKLLKAFPHASLTAVDASAAMLGRLAAKKTAARLFKADMCRLPEDLGLFDVITCSFALQWDHAPFETFNTWRSFLLPGGSLYAITLGAGNFRRWWSLFGIQEVYPSAARWAYEAQTSTHSLCLRQSFQTAGDFLRHLKATGATALPPALRRPAISEVRRALRNAPQPFEADWQILFLHSVQTF